VRDPHHDQHVGSAAIVAGKRAIWRLSGDIELYDCGPVERRTIRAAPCSPSAGCYP
jgi:hypothetical protein